MVENIVKPWRYNVVPNKDVREGKYENAEFMADLQQVYLGKAEDEYQNPDIFFNRTKLTKGIKSTVSSILRRVCGLGGDPVDRLKATLGGGKTHTETFIYHLFKGKDVDKNPIINNLLDEIGIEKIPKVNIAVLVGSAIGSADPISIPDLDYKINTLWGLLAYQIGKDDAYNIIKSYDIKSVAPGSDDFLKIFDKFGPCVILLDELVTYAKNIYNRDGLPSGTYNSLTTFVQNLTEAVKRTKNSVLIISLPTSDTEKTIEGQIALEEIGNKLGRVEAIWRAADADEGIEIVRKKLCEPIKDEKVKEAVCREFNNIYKNNGKNFPKESDSDMYYKRSLITYPFHPEYFDLLYSVWSPIEGFQSTRHLLRLSAAILYRLWIGEDKSLMIMPGNLPIDSPDVREELVRHLSPGWNSVIDIDIIEETKKIDNSNPRFMEISATKRVARTIFLGSAPSSKQQINRGIEVNRILLGVVQPGDNIPSYLDVLEPLSKTSHIYHNEDKTRYWYDLYPNLNKTADDRAKRLDQECVYTKIATILKSKKGKGEFVEIHKCSEEEDVPDEEIVKLVVLPPNKPYIKDDQECEALKEARRILSTRGSTPRIYKNMLLFIAADRDIVIKLNDDVRNYLAWQSILDDHSQGKMDLETYQIGQAEVNCEMMNKIVKSRIDDVYMWLLVPTQKDTNPIIISPFQIKKGEGTFISRASTYAIEEEYLIVEINPEILEHELKIHDIWKDKEHIDIKQLWEYFSSFVYLRRLRDSSILMDSVKEGVRRKLFGYAQDIDESSRKYLGLEIGKDIEINMTGILVRKDVVLKQITEEHYGKEGSLGYTGGMDYIDIGSIEKRLNTRFNGIVEIDPERFSRDYKKISENIIQLLTRYGDVSLTLEIVAISPKGIPKDIEKDMIENCKELNFKIIDFGE